MSTNIREVLASRFGFDDFRPGQERVVEALLSGRSALAVFPTGGGKSLCYQLPALEIEGLTLVVSPLIALMKDQIDFLKGRGIEAARLDSSMAASEVVAVNEAIQKDELKLLYVAPERFGNERFVSEMKRARIGLFAIDEAHCISEWGHNFRPDYLKLAETVQGIGAERVLALTATATPSVVDDICRAFSIAHEDSVVTGFYRPNLTMLTNPVPADQRDKQLLTRLRERPSGPTIVYVTLQRTAEELAGFLSQNRLPARAYHAGMEADIRHEVQEWWMREPNGIVVATIAFGMGIDKSNVRYVYHYNLPKSLESYSQEIGRAGRDEQPSIVELLACAEDIPCLENFAYGDTPSGGAIEALVQEATSWSPEDPVAISQYELSQRLDMRMAVLRTALTYLELMGLIRSGTPVYTGYELKLATSVSDVVSQFPGVHGDFVRSIFDYAKRGKIWYGLNPDDAANVLGVERRRVVRAIEVMEQKGLVEVRAGDVRIPYWRLSCALDPVQVTGELIARFERRESQEIARLKSVVDLVELDACQVNSLVGYFGEERHAPCNHCTWCLTKTRQSLPSPPNALIDLEPGRVETLLRRLPLAQQAPRQLAKLLCGISSPSFTKLKLTRDPLFGSLEHHAFAEVVAWCDPLIKQGSR
ncbi:MAG: RecQ family ATP-dependent DNA helicase [Fimbriimonas sp.]|nr:RecQ family ATP-dependent DNA helicase [Fimbriimonas sp.]